MSLIHWQGWWKKMIPAINGLVVPLITNIVQIEGYDTSGSVWREKMFPESWIRIICTLQTRQPSGRPAAGKSNDYLLWLVLYLSMADLLDHLDYIDDSNQVPHHTARMRAPGEEKLLCIMCKDTIARTVSRWSVKLFCENFVWISI
jgi:hypothetical protein